MTIVAAVLLLTSCAPVLNRELMREGTREVSLDRLRETPDNYKGKLFILGGVILNSKFTETGTQIEALYVPVDSSGYLNEGEQGGGRFLALSPKARLLDPAVYKRGREITFAGEFLELRKGKIDDMEYVYPVFEIRQIYLWRQERTYYYTPYYYPYYYNYPFMYDPWGRPYPSPYWPPPPW